MKMLTNKQEERLERKKKKLSALATVMELNDTDRQKKVHKKSMSEESLDEPCKKKQKQDEKKMATNLTADQYHVLKKELNKKKNDLKNIPKLRLKFIGDKASLSVTPEQRQPLVLDDIQNLLMVSLLKSNSPFTPWRWCHLEKVNKLTHTVVLLLEGISSYDFISNESLFNKSGHIFDTKLELLLPSGEDKHLIEHLACVPLTESYKERLLKQYGTLEAAMGANIDHKLVYKSVFPINESKPKQQNECNNLIEDEVELPLGDKFSRTQLLLSPLQMIDEDYPIPLKGELANRCKRYILSQDSYAPVSSKSPMFGLDCEMCKVVTGRHEVARISVVNEKYESVYETLVRPELQIMDYLTPWSGITKEMMEEATKSLKEVQQDLRKLLTPDSILVGQSLQFDLHALQMMHPYIVDTSVIYSLSGDRVRKSKLQTLAKEFLGEEIQKAFTGHNSIEDSCASLKLTKLKLANDIYFGDAILQQKKEFIEKKHHTEISSNTESPSSLVTATPEVTTTIFSHAAKTKKKSLIITTNNTKVNYEEYFKQQESNSTIQYIQLPSAKKAINKTTDIVMDHEFNLTHITLQSTDDNKMEKSIITIDKWISKVWKSVALNGLFVVILSGNTNSGVALIKIKNSGNFNSLQQEQNGSSQDIEKQNVESDD